MNIKGARATAVFFRKKKVACIWPAHNQDVKFQLECPLWIRPFSTLWTLNLFGKLASLWARLKCISPHYLLLGFVPESVSIGHLASHVLKIGLLLAEIWPKTSQKADFGV